MAVKNQSQKTYCVPLDTISKILLNPDFCQCLGVEYIEAATYPDGAVEFRYKRKTTMTRYGRNYFVKIKKLGENQSEVTVATQSRKVTVLFDTQWKEEVQKTFGFIDMFLRKQ